VFANKIFIATSFIICTNLIIICSLHFNFIPQVYFLGFRFNLFLLLNLILILLYNRRLSDDLFVAFNKFGRFKHWVSALLTPIVFSAAVVGTAYTFGKVRIPKNKYFYEFGISSLLDFPMYFIWTLPFLVSFLYLWFIIIHDGKIISAIRDSFLISISAAAFYLFNYYEVDLINHTVNFSLVFAASLYTYSFFMWSNSLWASALSVFTLVYSVVLVFGTTNQFMIKTFFARNYDEWEGFFNLLLINNVPTESVLILLMIFFSVIFFNLGKENRSNK